MTEIEKLGAGAKKASRVLALAGTVKKNEALTAIRKALLDNKARILAANAQDMANAKESGLKKSFMDRLLLTDSRIDAMAKGLQEIAALQDPVGEVVFMSDRPNGLTIGKKRVPLGVVAIIYESRPNVTVDAAALCLKSGNACILRGGKESINSNAILVDIIRKALKEAGLPEDCVNLVQDTSRESVNELMTLREFVDVLIPRGGPGLIKAVVDNASVPVIETGAGICHTYVDDLADMEMAANIVENAKCQRPSVCNAMETLLVHRSVIGEFLSLVLPRLQKHNVELRCDPLALEILKDSAIAATEEDWMTEYNDLILSIKTVEDMGEAIEHITKYGTGHSEAIITKDYQRAQRFLNEVDAAAVFVNASTRFTDGAEFGLGAEIGIATQKMHARGPMGLKELTSGKFVVYGNGHIRS